jgi:hypothetical protein
MTLSQDELTRLEQLEDQQARGEAVAWDEPKTIRGVVVRDVETVTFTDKRDNTERTKRVLTLRTADGLQTIFEGPGKLNDRLFEGKRFKDDPNALGPPRTGELVIVTYLGDKPSQTTGREWKDFDVYRGSPGSTGSGETSDKRLSDDPGPAERPPHGDEDAPVNDDDITF